MPRLGTLHKFLRATKRNLRWQDVDFEQDQIVIRHKVIQAKIAGNHILKMSDALKTKASLRAFPLVPIVKDRLLKRKAWIARNKALPR